MRNIVLASTSPRRKEILERIGLPFIADPGEYEEDLGLNMPPDELVKHLALGKAMAVKDRHPDSLIIGADIVVVLDGEVLGKPHTPGRAKEMLLKLSGKVNTIVSGYAVLDTASGKSITNSTEIRVHVRSMLEREIDWYITTQEPLDRAGAYALQGIGALFIEKLEGDYTGAIGIPLCSLMQTLQQFGVEM